MQKRCRRPGGRATGPGHGALQTGRMRNAPTPPGFAPRMGKRRIPQVSYDPPDTLHFAVVRDEVDLHGLTGRQAVQRADTFVRSWATREPGAVVRVITGRGVGSEGAPVIQTKVRELLLDDLAPRIDEWAIDFGGGAFLVRVR